MKNLRNKPLAKILALFAAWRAGLLVLASIADKFLAYDPSFPYSQDLLATYDLPRWIYSWANFDGVHYLTIVEKGYLGTGLIQAFFPGYPLLVGLANLLVGNALVAGLLISNLSMILLMYVFYRLVTDVWNSDLAWRSLIVMLLFPTSFFLGALYTESLFLLIVMGSFWSAHHRRWWLAGSLAALAAATRVVGVMLVPALALELFLYIRTQKSQQLISYWKHWLAITWGASGLLAYMVYLQRVFADPLYFFHVQSEFGGGRQESIVLYPQVVWRSIKILLTYRPIDLKYFAFILEFVAGVGAVLGLIFSFKQIKWSYLLFSLGAVLVPTLTGTFSSMPRYIMVAFPLYIIIAQVLKDHKLAWYSWLGLSTLVLLCTTILFIQGYWVA